MNLNDYILKNYGGNPQWYKEECERIDALSRINRILDLKRFLDGKHRILERPDVLHKGTTFAVSKTVINVVSTIVDFHKTLLLGKHITLSSKSQYMVDVFEKVYRKGRLHGINFEILNDLICFGNGYEYVYYKNGKIQSKVFDPADSYPVYSIDGEMLAFVEHYSDILTAIDTYHVYTDSEVITYSNEGSYLHEVSRSANVSGLPTHYKIGIGEYGKGILDDLIPVLDKITVVLNRMSDAVDVLSLNPVAFTTGGQLAETVSAEAVGYCISLDDGEFKYAVAMLDSQSCKLLLDNLWSSLWTLACVPSIIMGQSNVANISELSLKMLYSLSINKALKHQIYLQEGFYNRHEIIEKILGYQGITFGEDELINVEFNMEIPSSASETIDNLSKQYNDGAISLDTYCECSPYVKNVAQELQRLQDNQAKQ